MRHNRRICKGIKMLIKQAGCNSCFKSHEICMALYEPYAERMAHWHATERNRHHFTLCWESVALTPDANAQPSHPCMKSHLKNDLIKNSLSDTLTLLSATEAFRKHMFVRDVAFLQSRFNKLYVQLQRLFKTICWCWCLNWKCIPCKLVKAFRWSGIKTVR